jgi:hypothetical protein
VIALVVIGTACISIRANLRHRTELMPGDSLWRLTYSVSFHARKAGAKLRTSLPQDTRHLHVFQQEEKTPQVTSERVHPSRSDAGHDLVVTTPHAGQFNFTLQYDIQESPRPSWRSLRPTANITAKERQEYLRADNQKGLQVNEPVVLQTLERLSGTQGSKAELVERLFEYCVADIGLGAKDAPQDAAGALGRGVATPLGRARAMIALCRASKIPARLVTGFKIEREPNLQPQVWVEALVNGQWEPYDPESGFGRDLPTNFLPIRRDSADVVHANTASGITELAARFSIVPYPLLPNSGAVDLARRNPLDILNLTRLPAQMHDVLTLLLLLPLGALLTAFVRTIVGIRTFGTFTPTLLALAFIFNDRQTGIIVFITVMIVGLSSRSLLDRLRLLLVPRLSIILTLVVLCMVFAVSVLDYFEKTPAAQAVLLPMVILTMTVERFYITSEEDSLRFALQLLVATIGMAFCIYLVLQLKEVGHRILEYPEIHVFTVALLVLIGRYTGYRWTELWRFRDVK